MAYKPTVQANNAYQTGNDYPQSPIEDFYEVESEIEVEDGFDEDGLPKTKTVTISNYKDGIYTKLASRLEDDSDEAKEAGVDGTGFKSTLGFNKRRVLVDPQASVDSEDYSKEDVITFESEEVVEGEDEDNPNGEGGDEPNGEGGDEPNGEGGDDPNP